MYRAHHSPQIRPLDVHLTSISLNPFSFRSVEIDTAETEPSDVGTTRFTRDEKKNVTQINSSSADCAGSDKDSGIVGSIHYDFPTVFVFLLLTTNDRRKYDDTA